MLNKERAKFSDERGQIFGRRLNSRILEDFGSELQVLGLQCSGLLAKEAMKMRDAGGCYFFFGWKFLFGNFHNCYTPYLNPGHKILRAD